ncbi:MAG: NAD-dependent epimerase/dehydratase family protein [Myxococcota bacterium]|nr:NAD-dependent epimerase/dehydratase family protein [Myxococcota bacterium]
MHIVVTGATGFIGGAIARRLLEREHRVSVLVRDPEAASVAELRSRGVTIAKGSILDPNTIAAASKGADVMIHAAGIASPRASARALRWTTIAGTENVLAAARHAELERVVIISSADVTLANVDRVHWDEKRDLAELPIGARARALRLAEEIALTSSDETLSVCALRPGLVWGPGDLSMLPSLIREARAGGIRMYGDGRNLVATTYVETLADAAIAAAKSPSAPSHAYYIGDPEFLELREFLQLLTKSLALPAPRTGPPFALSYPMAVLRAGRGDGPLPEEIVRRARSTLFDVQKAIADLDFRAEIAVDEGMKRLARWAEELGGPDAIVAGARALPDDAALEREALAAGG